MKAAHAISLLWKGNSLIMKPDRLVLILVKALHARAFKSMPDHVPCSQVVEFALAKADILSLLIFMQLIKRL